jgi:hypothetical protein
MTVSTDVDHTENEMIFIHRASLNDDNASVLEPLSIPTDDDNVGDNEIVLTGPYTVSSVSGTESTDVDHTKNEMIFNDRASLNDYNLSVLEPLSIPTDDDNVGDNEIFLTGPYTVSSVSGTESTDVDHSENDMIINDRASLNEPLSIPTDDDNVGDNEILLTGPYTVSSVSGTESTDVDHTENEMICIDRASLNVDNASVLEPLSIPTDDDNVGDH